MGRVQDKVAIVTGGASGIGESTAITLAREGAKVVVTDIQDKEGEAVVARIREAGGDALYLSHDVVDETAWIGVIEKTIDTYGGLDILVNNAGIGLPGAIKDYPLERWRELMAVNMDGVFLGTKHAIEPMEKRGGGSIIILSSLAGLRGSPGLAAYNATKGGVRLFAKGVAREHAASQIRVNSVHPGIIDTPIWTKMDDLAPSMPDASQFAPEGANKIDVDAVATAVAPLGYAGSPQDIANGILFLASDESRYVTGSELVIDGGMSA